MVCYDRPASHNSRRHDVCPCHTRNAAQRGHHIALWSLAEVCWQPRINVTRPSGRTRPTRRAPARVSSHTDRRVANASVVCLPWLAGPLGRMLGNPTGRASPFTTSAHHAGHDVLFTNHSRGYSIAGQVELNHILVFFEAEDNLARTLAIPFRISRPSFTSLHLSTRRRTDRWRTLRSIAALREDTSRSLIAGTY